MKILIIHNHWLEKGGEDEVVGSEIAMLKSFGHKVISYERSNEEIKSFSLYKKLNFLIKDIIWSKKTYKEIKQIVIKEKPDVAHIHNIFVMISPSVYYALSEENIPIVQALHNYRLICPKGILYRNSNICEDCVGRNFLPSVIHRCWRNSLFLTFFLAKTLNVHFKRRTFQEKIDVYIASSEFSKNKFIEAGLPDKKIFIKPNFVDINTEERKDFQNFALFVGRLVDYKGINTLISAFRKLGRYYLKIIGDGPLYKELKEKIIMMNKIELLGKLSDQEKIQYMKKSSFVIFPTECYENMPMVIVESFACGVPVIASNIGAIKELVEDEVTGLLFEPRNSEDLANRIKYLMENRELLGQMRENAYRVYREKYAPEENYQILINIYKKAIENHKKLEENKIES